MKAKKKSTFNPLSTQVSFVINTVKGDHLGKQCLLVSVNGYLFVLSPRTIQKRFRFYDSGFNIFIDPNVSVQISIAVFTPSNNKSGYMHCFTSYKMEPPTKARSQNVELHSYGNSYIISLSLFVSPSFIYPPITNKNKPSKKAANFNPTNNAQLERQKKSSEIDSFSDKYSLSYSISTGNETSSAIDLDQNEDKIMEPKISSFTNFLSDYSKTDETSTMGGSSYSD